MKDKMTRGHFNDLPRERERVLQKKVVQKSISTTFYVQLFVQECFLKLLCT